MQRRLNDEPHVSATARTKPNAFYLCHTGQAPVPWTARPRRTDAPYLRYDYLDGALRTLDALVGPCGLSVYVTRDVRALPAYGDDVVAVVIGDEWARRPAYVDRILATFKEYGDDIALASGVRLRRPLLSGLALAQYARNFATRIALARAARRERASASRGVLEAIPLGYYNQLALPIAGFDERSVDVSFLGSVAHERYRSLSPQALVGTAKSRSRETMLDALRRLRERRPETVCDVGLTPSFKATGSEDAAVYSKRLMRARICLCPRGMSLETYRFFEAMRYGCVVVTEALPDRWFYRGSPALAIDDWSRLGDVIETLLADPNRMRALHRAALGWWDEVCSERALGAHMARVLAATGLPVAPRAAAYA